MTKIIECLKEIGFNTYEAKVYTALLKKYPATGYEITKLAQIPQARTYDTLKVLTQKGIVSATTQKPVQYIPIKPKELTKNYKKRMTHNVDYLEKHLPELNDQNFEPINQITDSNEFFSRILESINSAEKEIYLEIWAQDFKHFEKELLNAYNRNVEVRIISYEKLNSSFGLVYEHPFVKKIEASFNGRYIALTCDNNESFFGRIHSISDANETVIHSKNKEMNFLIKEFITHDMMLLDIQSRFPKELVYEYGNGLKHLHDKIFGVDNIYKVTK